MWFSSTGVNGKQTSKIAFPLLWLKSGQPMEIPASIQASGPEVPITKKFERCLKRFADVLPPELPLGSIAIYGCTHIPTTYVSAPVHSLSLCLCAPCG